MGIETFSSAFSEADLHGLVDGHIDPDRHADLSRRLVTHPADRARVDAWREQNDLIKATFSDVVREPVPLSLNLMPPPRLRCVASEGRTMAPGPPSVPLSRHGTEARRTRRRLIGVSVLVAGFGLVGGWVVLDGSKRTAFRDSAADLVAVETSLAKRTLDALASAPSPVRDASRTVRHVRDMPTATIPDLEIKGFGFAGATLQASDPATMIFFYDDGAGEHIAIGVAREQAVDIDNPIPSRRVVTWRRHGKRFALAGTVDDQRLAVIAEALQVEQDASDSAN